MGQIWTRPWESHAYQLSYPQSYERGKSRQKPGSLIHWPPCQPKSHQCESEHDGKEFRARNYECIYYVIPTCQSVDAAKQIVVERAAHFMSSTGRPIVHGIFAASRPALSAGILR